MPNWDAGDCNASEPSEGAPIIIKNEIAIRQSFGKIRRKIRLLVVPFPAGLTYMLSLVLLQLECRKLARAPLQSSMFLRAAASMDGKNVGSMEKNYHRRRGEELDTRGWYR